MKLIRSRRTEPVAWDRLTAIWMLTVTLRKVPVEASHDSIGLISGKDQTAERKTVDLELFFGCACPSLVPLLFATRAPQVSVSC